MLRFILMALFALGYIADAYPQGAVLQGGPTAPGRSPMYVGQGSSQAVVQDSGPAGGGAVGFGLAELGMTKRGIGAAPFAGGGTGEYGTTLCNRDAPLTNATGYHFLCFDSNAQGGGLIAYGAGGAAPQLPLSFIVNGVQYQFPFSIGGILGPSPTIINNVPCWGNTVGTLLANCPKQPLIGPAVTTNADISCWGNTTGTLLAVCAKQPVIGPATSVMNQFACWSNVTGTLLANCTAAPNLFVRSTGNDNNDCLSAGTACLTLQAALNLAARQYFQGNNMIINVGPGTFGPGVIGGELMGSASGSLLGARISIIGAGSASTTINAGSCAATTNALSAGSGAQLFVGSMTLTSACAGGNGLLLFNRATGGLADGDVTFGSAGNAQVQASERATFTGANALNIRFAGNAVYGFLLSSHSSAILSTNAVFTMSSPVYSGAFIDAIDGSFFDSGLNSQFSGTATGYRYLLNINSFIDTEQNLNPLPGSMLGILGQGSSYYQQLMPCFGGQGGCPIVTPATGLGSGGVVSMFPNSIDKIGMVRMTAGTGAATSGVVIISTRSQVFNCVVSLSNANGPWANGATIQNSYTPDVTAPQLNMTWFNGGVALTNGNVYDINYICA